MIIAIQFSDRRALATNYRKGRENLNTIYILFLIPIFFWLTKFWSVDLIFQYFPAFLFLRNKKAEHFTVPLYSHRQLQLYFTFLKLSSYNIQRCTGFKPFYLLIVVGVVY